MHFEHSGEIWRDFPQLVAGVLFAEGITAGVSSGYRAATFTAVASRSLLSPSRQLPLTATIRACSTRSVRSCARPGALPGRWASKLKAFNLAGP